jgi:hypothetical protein
LAASAAPSTPSGEFSVLGDFEEDRKPNIEYLDALNEHNKRSRSVEDEGDTERKQVKVGDALGQEDEREYAELPMNGVESSGTVNAEDAIAEQDPIVYGTLFCTLKFFFSITAPLLCAMLNGSVFQWMANQCHFPRLERSTMT